MSCSQVERAPGRDFIRRSKRLNPNLDGFRNVASAQKAAGFPSIYAGVASVEADLALHLSVENIQSVAMGFLQMHPSAISSFALLELDNDD
ncbi:hypothetical protein C2845_PM18G07960 [Panicum miliaceum]|uniref:Uncharacterized protein n=1 Tax=Panicum miliaceum TaxID=4540 RepID=A0A3L6PMD9_PANMI|nr:hypothetical protein C2845_PM18G07960 [Panicum miliaceum]